MLLLVIDYGDRADLSTLPYFIHMHFRIIPRMILAFKLKIDILLIICAFFCKLMTSHVVKGRMLDTLDSLEMLACCFQKYRHAVFAANALVAELMPDLIQYQ